MAKICSLDFACVSGCVSIAIGRFTGPVDVSFSSPFTMVYFSFFYVVVWFLGLGVRVSAWRSCGISGYKTINPAQKLMRKTELELYEKNCQSKHCNRHYAKRLLPARFYFFSFPLLKPIASFLISLLHFFPYVSVRKSNITKLYALINS